MSLFYTKHGEPYVPDKINPELSHLAMAIVKTCRLTLKFQMKTNGLNNALKGGDKEQMKEIMLKCIEKNKVLYNQDMYLSGAVLGEVDDEFFNDKDVEFFENQIKILIDFAYINCVIEAHMMPLMSAACEKTLNKKISELLFFMNQFEGEEKADTNSEAGENEGNGESEEAAAADGKSEE